MEPVGEFWMALGSWSVVAPLAGISLFSKERSMLSVLLLRVGREVEETDDDEHDDIDEWAGHPSVPRNKSLWLGDAGSKRPVELGMAVLVVEMVTGESLSSSVVVVVGGKRPTGLSLGEEIGPVWPALSQSSGVARSVR